MKKFTKLNESKKTIEKSINKHDFIKNLIEETLSVDDGKIKGKDILAESINKIIDINDSKTTINVLENVKLKSYHNLNIEWINGIIDGEKTKINEAKVEPKIEETEGKTELINESVENINEEHHLNTREEKINYILKNNSESDVYDTETLQQKTDEEIDQLYLETEENLKENDIDPETRETGEIEEEGNSDSVLLTKNDFEIGDTVYINLEGQTGAEIIAMDDSEIILNKLDDEDSDDIKLTWEEFNDIVDKDKKDDFIDPVEVEEDVFMEKVNYMNDIDQLSKLMESIDEEPLNEEHHLETKEERIDYILSKMENDDIADTIITKVSKLPDYVKNSDIEKTLKNMSDNEIEKLYKEVEKIEGVD